MRRASPSRASWPGPKTRSHPPFVEQVSREPRLRDPETNTYGGLYLWADQEAYERYIKGEVFNAIKADQNLKNVESRDFGVFEDLSSLTMPRLRAV